MMLEALTISLLVGIGISIVSVAGGRSVWTFASLALPTGVAGVSAVGLMAATVGLDPDPGLVLGSSALLVSVWLGMRRERLPPLWPTVITVLSFGVIAGGFYSLGLVAVTADSFLYMSVGAILEGDAGLQLVPPSILQRGVVVPLLHSLGGEFYLRPLAPMMAVSTLGVLAWLGSLTLGVGARRPRGFLLLGAGAALLATNNRFVFNSFYVNGHMLFAVWVLIFVGIVWLVATAKLHERFLVVAVAVLPALSIIRPEASLWVPLMIAPALPVRSIGQRWKSAVLVVAGVSTLLWQSVLIRSFGLSESPPGEVVVLAMMGGIVALIGVWWRRLQPLVPEAFAQLALGLVMVGLVVFGFIEPDVIASSWDAIVENVVFGEGRYGISILVLLGLLLIVVWRRVTKMQIIMFPLVAAVPFSLLMAHLRAADGGAYRVGPGDSFNRMLLHWMPLAVFALITMGDSGLRWPSESRVASDDIADPPTGAAISMTKTVDTTG